MHPVVALFGAACCGTIVLALRGNDRDAQFLSVALLAGWAATQQAWLFNSLGDLIILDTAMAVLAIVLVRVDRASWRRWYLAAALVQLGLDTVYERLGVSWYLGYMFLYNIAFVVQLAAIGSTGAPNVVGWLVICRDRCLSRKRLV